MILRWDKPPKKMTTQEWQSISADSAPPGVYTPNMSDEDALTWRAKYIGGSDARVEIRKRVVGKARPSKGTEAMKRLWPTTQHFAEVKIIVDRDSIRVSANGTMDFTDFEFGQLSAAVTEARLRLKEESE